MFESSSARFHALFSAYLSIFCGTLEAVFSLLAGSTELSMSLYGVALMATVDVAGSILIIVFYTNMTSMEYAVRQKRQELRYTFLIGCFMMILGIFLVVDRYFHL